VQAGVLRGAEAGHASTQGTSVHVATYRLLCQLCPMQYVKGLLEQLL